MGLRDVLGRERSSLVLLHPTALPDPPGRSYGVGELGSQATRFLDWLAEGGFVLWQVLPLGHTGYGNSPYQTFSRYAGSPYLVSVERLLEAGDLTPAEHDAYVRRVEEAGLAEGRADYGWLYRHKVGADWGEASGRGSRHPASGIPQPRRRPRPAAGGVPHVHPARRGLAP